MTEYETRRTIEAAKMRRRAETVLTVIAILAAVVFAALFRDTGMPGWAFLGALCLLVAAVLAFRGWLAGMAITRAEARLGGRR